MVIKTTETITDVTPMKTITLLLNDCITTVQNRLNKKEELVIDDSFYELTDEQFFQLLMRLKKTTLEEKYKEKLNRLFFYSDDPEDDYFCDNYYDALLLLSVKDSSSISDYLVDYSSCLNTKELMDTIIVLQAVVTEDENGVFECIIDSILSVNEYHHPELLPWHYDHPY